MRESPQHLHDPWQEIRSETRSLLAYCKHDHNHVLRQLTAHIETEKSRIVTYASRNSWTFVNNPWCLWIPDTRYKQCDGFNFLISWGRRKLCVPSFTHDFARTTVNSAWLELSHNSSRISLRFLIQKTSCNKKFHITRTLSGPQLFELCRVYCRM